MREHLAGLGLEAEFIAAVDGRALPPQARPAGVPAGMLPGELGCYLSHLSAWQALLDSGDAHALILEDDVSISPKLKSVIEAVTALPISWDAVRLSSLQPVRGITLCELDASTRLVLANKSTSGAQGYLLSAAGAKRMIACLRQPRVAIDTALDSYWEHHLVIPIVSPCPISENPELESSITVSSTPRLADQERRTVARHLKRVWRAKLRRFMVARLAVHLKRELGLGRFSRNQCPEH